MYIKKSGVIVFLVCSLLITLLLAACGDNTSTSVPAPTSEAPSPTATVTPQPANPTATPQPAVPTATPIPATTTPVPPTATSAPAPTTAAATTAAQTTAASTTAPGASGGTSVDVDNSLFIDDRSDAVEVLRSYYNAINRKEYVRAYSYWNNPGQNNSGQPQPYPQFEQGYANTSNVQLIVGQVGADAATGQRYYGVPVTIKATNNGAAQTFVGCYLLRKLEAAFFTQPPFKPLGIENAAIQAVSSDSNTNQLMAQSCKKIPAPDPNANGPVQLPPPDPVAIDPSQYIDNRSTATDVLRSFYNSINRKEYARAYFYWSQPGTSATSQPPLYPQFEQGYQTTARVELTTGKVITGAAAGTVYYQVPVKLVSHLIGDRVQTFVGCYTVKQPQPANFGAPPFVPMGISSAKVQEIQNINVDFGALMAKACN